MQNEQQCTNESDLSDRISRKIWIVTTAALPWKTGTSINPLMRALYILRKSPGHEVFLMIPWLEDRVDRVDLYGTDINFDDGRAGRMQQIDFVKNWASKSAKMPVEANKLLFRFYPAKYQRQLGSIFPLINICSLIKKADADVAILEEPEHINWLRMPSIQEASDYDDASDRCASWSDDFNHVIGIIHTNYPAYAKGQGAISGLITAPTIGLLSSIVVQAYCHRVIKLSETLPNFAPWKECTCNVHGVRSDFLRNFERLHPTFPLSIIDDLAFSSLEKEKSIDTSESDDGFTQIYFVGKLLWSGKGFDRLLQCQERFRALTGNYFSIDVYGGGPEEELIKSKFRRESGNNNVASCSCDKLPETSVNEASELYLAMVDSVFSSSTSLRALAIENNHPQLCPTSEVGKDILQGEKLESKKSSPLFMELAGGAIHTAAKTCHAVYNLTCSAVDGVFEKPKNAFSVKECSDPIPAQFMGVKDHSLLRKYKIFVNPSVTEVLCTTTAEALAMEKWVIIPAHPSNIFFYQFPNCLTYETLDGFVRCLKHALEHDTKALSGDLAHVLSWEAATERLIRAAAIHTDKISESKGGNDSRLRWLHTESGKVLDQKFIRDFIGGSRDTLDEYLDEQ